MANTAELLRSKSENLKNGILQLKDELKKTNDEIMAYKQSHEAAVADLKAKHEAEMAQLVADNEDLTELVENNTAFISTIESSLGE